MCINMRKLNRFYNTLIFTTQRLRSFQEHELLERWNSQKRARERQTIKSFNYYFLPFRATAENFVLAPRPSAD